MSDRFLQEAIEPVVASVQTSAVGRGTTSTVRVLAGRKPGRALVCAGISMAMLALAACNDQNTDAVDGIGTAIEMPRGLGSLRAIDQERLILEATVGSEPLLFSRNGQTHRGRFELSDNRTYELNVRFSYRATGRSEPIILAEIEPRQISLALVSRTIRISADDYNRVFDEDRDGIYNIDEVTAGTDPLVNETAKIQSAGLVDVDLANADLEKIELTQFLGEDQGDCRLADVTLPNAAAGLPATIGALSASASSDGPASFAERFVAYEIRQLNLDTVDSFAPRLTDGQKRYQAAFILAESGRLSIEHSGGEPRDTGAVVFDRSAASTGSTSAGNDARVVAFTAQTASATPDGVPARLNDLELAAGLYCLVLYAEGEDGGQVTDLSDLVLTVSHLAN